MALVFTGITSLGWSVIAMSVFAGVVGGRFIYKKFPNLFSQDRKMKKIIKNPHLLMEKLQAQGKIYDHLEDGRRVEIGLKVELDDKLGKEVLVLETKEPLKKLEEIKKEVSKKETKIKKKVKKIKKISKKS